MTETRAVTIGDLAYSRLPAFKRKVDRAIDLIAQVVAEHLVGVSFSTGKDSTVTLDLVRRIFPDVPAAYFSSGSETEYDQNAQLLRDHYPTVTVLESEQTLADLCRKFGYWGHAAEVVDDTVDFFAFMVGEPSYRFVRMFNLDTVTMGLRAGESAGRRMSSLVNGQFYPIKYQFVEGETHYHFTPISRWDDYDIWAYIASRNLQYNAVYDTYAKLGIPRKQWRVSMLLGESASNLGRFSFLKQIAPDKFDALAIDFPKIRRMI